MPLMTAILNQVRSSAVNHLLGFRSLGSLPPRASAVPNAMTTAELASAAFETNEESLKTFRSAALHFLTSDQQGDGSWTDRNSTDPWDTSATAWAIAALAQDQLAEHVPSVSRGIEWLRYATAKGRGATTNLSSASPNTYASAYAARAFSICGQKDFATSSLAFLERIQNLDGGWGLYPGNKSDATLTAYVLHGLLESQSENIGSAMMRAARYLKEQAPIEDGVWPSWFENGSSVEGTAFCNYVIIRHDRELPEHFKQSVSFLEQRASANSLWTVDGEGQPWIAISVLLLAHVSAQHL